MSIQPSVAEFYNSRKRPAVDDLKNVSNPTKVLPVSEEIGDINDNGQMKNDTPNVLHKKIAYTKKDCGLSQTKKLKICSSSKSVHSLSKSKPDGTQMDIRTSLLSAANKKTASTVGQSKEDKVCDQMDVQPMTEPDKHHSSAETKCDEHSTLTTPELSTCIARKELNLGSLKTVMKSRTSRMEQLKAALKRFNEKKGELENTQDNLKLQNQENIKIDLEVLPSPLKTPTKMGHLVSPQGKLTPNRLFATPPAPLKPPSPLKSPLKSPAFQRYQALITEDRSTLVLPFKYRLLAEMFRSIDQVTSMLVNRKETVTMSKLRPAVQEMSRKNLTEYHFGQIKTVFPNAFNFSIEKYRIGNSEKYELVIKPLLSQDGKEGETMGPSVLLARRRTLFNALLELTKHHHEAFLKKLNPPMNIPRSRITRWHPEFPVDGVPDILSADLPKAPNVQHAASARDVLEKAHDFFVVNPRMERALKKVSEDANSARLSEPLIPLTPPTTPSVKTALHGVPTSLLEKVRAKQAARALEAMTRTPAQAKEAVRLTRLPELARILRNLFVTEKKGVLTREMVLEKLADSYRECLLRAELDDHLKLLAVKAPGWVTFCNLRKTDYVKLSRNADMSRIMTRLEALAEEKAI